MYYGRFSQEKRRWLIERHSPSDAAKIDPQDKVEDHDGPERSTEYDEVVVETRDLAI